MVGLAEAAAVDRLTAAGYDAEIERVPSEVGVGLVIRQTPEAGAALETGKTVLVAVSAGEATVTVTEPAAVAVVPNVLGQDHVEAGAAVDGLGLVADTFPVNGGEEAGVVTAQSPGPGTEVPRGQSVRLEVALGPTALPSAAIPDVTGPRAAVARARVREAGFTVRTVYRAAPSPEERGEVILQRPAAGTRAPGLTQVTLYVGR